MRNATVHRYELLPFLYTLFAKAAILNEPPIRPLFMVYVYLLLKLMDRHILKFLLFISIHHLVSYYSLTTKNHIIYTRIYIVRRSTPILIRWTHCYFGATHFLWRQFWRRKQWLWGSTCRALLWPRDIPVGTSIPVARRSPFQRPAVKWSFPLLSK